MKILRKKFHFPPWIINIQQVSAFILTFRKSFAMKISNENRSLAFHHFSRRKLERQRWKIRLNLMSFINIYRAFLLALFNFIQKEKRLWCGLHSAAANIWRWKRRDQAGEEVKHEAHHVVMLKSNWRLFASCLWVTNWCLTGVNRALNKSWKNPQRRLMRSNVFSPA